MPNNHPEEHGDRKKPTICCPTRRQRPRPLGNPTSPLATRRTHERSIYPDEKLRGASQILLARCAPINFEVPQPQRKSITKPRVHHLCTHTREAEVRLRNLKLFFVRKTKIIGEILNRCFSGANVAIEQ